VNRALRTGSQGCEDAEEDEDEAESVQLAASPAATTIAIDRLWVVGSLWVVGGLCVLRILCVLERIISQSLTPAHPDEYILGNPGFISV